MIAVCQPPPGPSTQLAPGPTGKLVPAGAVRLSHFAEVAGVYEVHNLTAALLLFDLHLWSEETVRARFTYRRPGLYVLPVRVYRATQVHELPDAPYYAGCKSWVELERELPDEGTPVLGDADFHDFLNRLERRLHPTTIV